MAIVEGGNAVLSPTCSWASMTLCVVPASTCSSLPATLCSTEVWGVRRAARVRPMLMHWTLLADFRLGDVLASFDRLRATAHADAAFGQTGTNHAANQSMR